MNTKERLYAVIGGCVGAVLTMVVCSFLPLGAQSQGDRFGEITCTGLKVVGPDGSLQVRLGGDLLNDGDHASVFISDLGYGGAIMCFSKDAGSVLLGATKYGGTVHVFGTGKDPAQARMMVDEHGAKVRVIGEGRDGQAHMSVDEYGGAVSVFGKGGSISRAKMGVNEYGNGGVSTWDKNGYRR